MKDEDFVDFDIFEITGFDPTPHINEWREYRCKHRDTWMTLEYKILKMSEMTTDHLTNCRNMLDRAAPENGRDTLAYEGLTSELEKRKSFVYNFKNKLKNTLTSWYQ